MQQHIDSYDFKGKKAIVRVDFNVPLNENFEITDDTRIRAAMPTLKKVLAGGGSLIIMSHLGRPKKVDAKYSLKHIVAHVSECLGVPVAFADDCQKA
ncbi:MAG: phosphoglycerate kinase, partial [Bacteroidales bacterium]|nr:phosphoglycerate kinase [Bacteroidales bacterium]